MKKKAKYQIRDIDPAFWTRVKVHAARSGITIRQLVLDAIKEYLIVHD